MGSVGAILGAQGDEPEAGFLKIDLPLGTTQARTLCSKFEPKMSPGRAQLEIYFLRNPPLCPSMLTVIF